ncbi:mitochondrial genome maintenance exonuclease 1 [Tachysurus vachellii]|uniref:mitochondrial genome maintenance exonuclease 1 n=1 Tax=Tachysurus vachellii TaxID=175792 RepID=UPI00296B2E50|nr:mitochondrial genome maintenance exonuclease 1 [Tachysurus vachellii]
MRRVCGRNIRFKVAETMRISRLWLQSCCVSAVLSGRFSVSSCSRMFSSFPGLRSRKKSSHYGNVDSDHYSSLVKSVVSTRISSQTPQSIEKEDQLLYGSIVKSKAQVCRPLKNPQPLFIDAKRVLDAENMEGIMTRIKLHRDSDHASIPSVTQILKKTMSVQQMFYLERWKKKMIAELGVEGFNEYINNLFTQGKLFHAAVEGILTGENNLNEDGECVEKVSGYLQSISHVLEDVTGVKAIESVVLHEPLQYLGIVDCVAVYKNSLCVIEWKTSERPKPFLHNTYDNPLQVVAYIGALNSDRNYNYQVDSGLIVVAYKDGSPAHTHFLKSDQVVQYWDKWLYRLEEYNGQ